MSNKENYKEQFRALFNQDAFDTEYPADYTTPRTQEDSAVKQTSFIYSQAEVDAMAQAIEDERIKEANEAADKLRTDAQGQIPTLQYSETLADEYTRIPNPIIYTAELQETERPRNVITEAYYPDKMTVEEFIRVVEKQTDAFIYEMQKLGINKPRYVEEWASLMRRWMEFN